MIRLTIFILIVACAGSCTSRGRSLPAKEMASVQDSVRLMAEAIAKDISREGPVAWLRYFENTPGFFMASDGELVFPNYDSAKNFINTTLVKSISKIELHWSNMRIEPFSGEFAGLAAIFHEDITDAAGKTFPQDGYFTALAHQTKQGWKLQHAHWSGKKH